ncbi:MAG: ribosome maturation factor RimP [Ignavibacteriales bacterium]
MNINKENIESEFNRIIEEKGFHLFELIVRGSQFKPVFEVFIDSENPVNANDCASVSRALSAFLDDEKFSFKDYRLDVSSPGIDKSLKFLWQFPKNVGRNFEIVLLENEVEQKFQGKLTAINGQKLVFNESGSEIEIEFNRILSAKVLISF